VIGIPITGHTRRSVKWLISSWRSVVLGVEGAKAVLK
jgi:hypothetical protein